MPDSLQMMSDFAKKLPLLTADQEAVLAGQIQAGNKRAGRRLAEHNIRLVMRLAHKHHYGSDDTKLADLVGEGMTGLCEAVQSFDPDKGRFTTHATHWIRARILAFLMNTGRIVRVGTTTHDGRKLHWNLRSVQSALESEGKDATPQAVAAALDMDPDKVEDLMDVMLARDTSTDLQVGSDDGNRAATVVDYMEGDIPDPESVFLSGDSMARVNERIARFRDDLSPKEQIVLDERILTSDPLPMRAVGELTGGSRQAVEQIQKRILVKLRRRLSDLYEQICLAPA